MCIELHTTTPRDHEREEGRTGIELMETCTTTGCSFETSTVNAAAGDVRECASVSISSPTGISYGPSSDLPSYVLPFVDLAVIDRLQLTKIRAEHQP